MYVWVITRRGEDVPLEAFSTFEDAVEKYPSKWEPTSSTGIFVCIKLNIEYFCTRLFVKGAEG